MWQLRLNADDTFLVLAPRWSDLAPVWQIALLTAVLVLPIIAILCLCRYEMRLIPRPAALGLLLLRLSIVCVLWIAIGLQPHLATVTVDESPGRVRIAVDLSSSMDVADIQRTADEKATLSRALRLTDIDSITRKQIVARVLGTDGLNVLAKLEQRHQIEIIGFHRHDIAMSADQLFERLSAKPGEQEAGATDLHKALANVKTPLLGVVVFSDGQHNVGEPPNARASELRKLGVPIFPVVIGSREPPNDLMIFDLQAPPNALKDETILVPVRCKVTNMPAQAMTVELQIDGKPVRDEHRQGVQHSGGDAIHSVPFRVKMDETGSHAVSVKATSRDGKEITLANNTASRIVRVIDDRAKVLLVDGDSRWEYHYLANALGRDPKVTLERVVFDQPRLGLIKGDDLDKAGLPKTKLPEPKPDRPDYDPLFDYDCIFLGDVSPEHVPVADRKRLERYVSERGGMLVFMAGKRYLPLAFAKSTGLPSPSGRGVGGEGDDPLVKMLPITEPREVATDKGFTLRVTGPGKLRQFLQLAPDHADAWPELPKHFWGIVGKRKPAATVLLTPVYDPKDAQPKEDADVGLLVQQNYGFGRVVFVGLDSTWRWRFRVGDVYHHRFWGQLARERAIDKLLPAGNRWVRFGPRDPVYFEGDEIELAVRFNESLPPLKDLSVAQVKVHRRDADGRETLMPTIALTKHPRQPNMLIAKLQTTGAGKAPSPRDLPQGTYRMELDIPPYRTQIAEPSEEKDTPGRDLFRVLPRDQPELRDLSTNWTVMQSLANLTDGKLYTPEDVEEIVDRLGRRIERKEDRGVRKPWEDATMAWWMLGVLLGLLTLEWGWRKWLDLP